MTYTKSATVERAREMSRLLRERNKQKWNELDREVVFALDALIASAEYHRMRQQTHSIECPRCGHCCPQS